MQISDLNPKVRKKIARLNLQTKFSKALGLFRNNPQHPSLHFELLEPKTLGIYSFRIDRKYRAILFIVGGKAEIINITLHYQ